MTACGTSKSVAPSQNSALNNISNSNGKAKTGYMQSGLDSWLKDEWTPVVEKDEEIREKYMEKVESQPSKSVTTTKITTIEELNQNTSQELSKKSAAKSKDVKYVEKTDKYPTLQEYLDKADVYFESQERDPSKSNVKKMESMPVIGK